MNTILLAVKGSSPQMRGAPLMLTFPKTNFRIIPADAGSTSHYAAIKQRD